MAKAPGKPQARGGARPPQSGRAKRSRPPKITTSELNRRRDFIAMQDRMVVLDNTMQLVLLELQKYQGGPPTEEE